MLQADGGSKRRLLPMLSASIASCGEEAPATLGPLLHAAALYEQLRTRAYRDIAASVLAELGASAIPWLATRGVCFGESIYDRTRCRHANDIDLLVPDHGAAAAAAALLIGRCGFSRVGDLGAQRSDLCLVHASGLPLVLHTAAVAVPPYAVPWDQLSRSAVILEAYGTRLSMPSAEDSLLQVILHASTGPHARSSRSCSRSSTLSGSCTQLCLDP
jgi:hypothetical protein